MEDDTPILTPQGFLRHVASARSVGVETFQIPPRMIIVYQRRHFDFVNQLIDGKPAEWWWYGDRLRMHIGSFNNVKIVAVTNFVGSPAAAMGFEELIACGARKIFEVGISGGIQPFLKPGDIVVAIEAVCDEGTTHQYFPNLRRLAASPILKRRLIEALNKSRVNHQVGAVLTTDGVYRETRSKMAKFRKMGVLAVNMETSALYAVAKYRGVEIASANVISDLLTESGWQPAFNEKRVLNNAETLLRVVVEAVSKA
ncbi:MAG: nucleoside phosphorylase [Candidatus Bathyarchaeota archaeon]|nr:nucleoside phosphorylase [Candidatus Bathyarchaeota archaeon]MDH5494303.1 nucleoside phosphorylase [Candidatus Bathyarchaeota archaeon]